MIESPPSCAYTEDGKGMRLGSRAERLLDGKGITKERSRMVDGAMHIADQWRM